ncbi:hypothetical protein JKF63_02295 [Porcisia hertigi]|uniref:LIM zinc-binding domain-containing protein n=1 Tax=Porcisia hertigi TaxID=2761500 RepID=A0A836I2E3_9TRYP|nr:hypothetical protein JKF63_02295 [Porcisia hertigi]
MEQQGETEVPPLSAPPIDAPPAQTSSFDPIADALLSLTDVFPAESDRQRTTQKKEDSDLNTESVQEDGSAIRVDTAQDTVNASAVKQEPESSGVDGGADFRVAAAVSLGSSSSSATKNVKKSVNSESKPPANDAGAKIEYSSAIAVKPKSTGWADQSRLSSAPSNSCSPRKIIRDACKRTEPSLDNLEGKTGAFYGPGGLSVNGQYKTIPEEYADYCCRNGISSNYRGPVYVVEDVCVPCHACGSPVDPVRRVPVGSLFFHEACLHCYLCGRRTGVAGLYLQVDRQALCSDCAGRGYEQWVPRQEAVSRGMVYGSIRGNAYAAIDTHDRSAEERQRRIWEGFKRKCTARVPVKAVGVCSTLNKSTIPGALPPSLTISSVHNRRNTSARSFALMERQQYYTQSDTNMLITVPDRAAPSPTNASRRQISSVAPRYGITDKGHT